MPETLPKSERLCGKTAVAALFEHGKSFAQGCLRCRYILRPEEPASRIVVSVPKRNFKRAVKRNLLKRRIRESYRRQKALLPSSADILFIYTAHEPMPYEVVSADMSAILSKIGRE